LETLIAKEEEEAVAEEEEAVEEVHHQVPHQALHPGLPPHPRVAAQLDPVITVTADLTATPTWCTSLPITTIATPTQPLSMFQLVTATLKPQLKALGVVRLLVFLLVPL
jgi:hypothetical protein